MALPMIRRSAASKQSNVSPHSFIPQITKLVIAVSDSAPSHQGLRKYLQSDLKTVAEQNPHIQFIVEGVAKGARGSLGVRNGGWIRVNGREKVIGMNSLDVNNVRKKVQLLLDSSGNKIVPIKKKFVESSNESVRGIWSPYHTEEGSTTHWKI